MSVMYLSVTVETTMEISACTFCVIPIFNVLCIYILCISTMILHFILNKSILPTQRSWDGIWLNRSAGEVKCKSALSSPKDWILRYIKIYLFYKTLAVRNYFVLIVPSYLKLKFFSCHFTDPLVVFCAPTCLMDYDEPPLVNHCSRWMGNSVSNGCTCMF